MDVLVAIVAELGLSWQVSAKQAVGVLDGAALPGPVRYIGSEAYEKQSYEEFIEASPEAGN